MTGSGGKEERREAPTPGAGRLLRLTLLALAFFLLLFVAVDRIIDRVHQGPEYTVLPRARVEAAPSWFDTSARSALRGAVEGLLEGRGFQVFDEEPVRVLGRRLIDLNLARSVVARREIPSQVVLNLRVPRPAAWYRWGGRTGLVDYAGRPLGYSLGEEARRALPRISWADSGPPREPGADLAAGARVVGEVERLFLAGLPRGFSLAWVDLSNLDYRLLRDSRAAQVRITLRTPGGSLVHCDWGHPPRSGYTRIPAADKLFVARRLLEQYPLFRGLQSIDLRYRHSPETWVGRRE